MATNNRSGTSLLEPIQIGQKFGRLTTVEKTHRWREEHWVCSCECGGNSLSAASALRNGRSRSCGCLKNEMARSRRLKHGRRGTSLYNRWASMIQRCENPNDRWYESYGGRGVTVCERWKNSFEDFLVDVGEPPTPKHQLDRIDNDKGYEPGNVRWATPRQQSVNKRTTVYAELDGVKRPLIEWCEILNLNYRVVKQRFGRLRWSAEKSLLTPTRSGFKGT